MACANPYDLEAIDSFKRIADREIELVVASEPDLLKAITDFYGLRHSVKRAERDLTSGVDLGNLEQLIRMKSETEIESSDQHVVNAVEYMLQHAFESRASDIHIEPKRDAGPDPLPHRRRAARHPAHAGGGAQGGGQPDQDHVAPRHRREAPPPGRPDQDRARRPGVELRVSTLPVAFGEKVVMRIFDPQVLLQDLSGLGFYPDELAQFNDFISRPHGIVLVTGPTGSGKTTTLYSALKVIAHSEINVTTIEDPIEMVYEGFNQTAVQTKVGITFAAALRHILRQDPDVIMVGEIRDTETAQYATQAALTGHLVFSTLHTNDASASISRLIDLGIERYLVSSTLIGTVAQRLVRRICPHCITERHLSTDEARTLRISVPEGKRIKVREGEGCVECRGTGYLGRSGIFEILPLDEKIKELVLEEADSPVIKREAIERGMRTLRQSALRKLAEGITTFEEVVRVTGLN